MLMIFILSESFLENQYVTSRTIFKMRHHLKKSFTYYQDASDNTLHLLRVYFRTNIYLISETSIWKVVYLHEFCLGWICWVRSVFLKGLEMETNRKNSRSCRCYVGSVLFLIKSLIFNSNLGYFYLKILRLTKDQFTPSASVSFCCRFSLHFFFLFK